MLDSKNINKNQYWFTPGVSNSNLCRGHILKKKELTGHIRRKNVSADHNRS